MATRKKSASPGKPKKKAAAPKHLSKERMLEKKKFLLSAGKEAIASAGGLKSGDVTTTHTAARRVNSALFGGRRGLGIVFADMDPTDSIRIVDTDPVDGLARIDFDTRDPIPPGW